MPLLTAQCRFSEIWYNGIWADSEVAAQIDVPNLLSSKQSQCQEVINLAHYILQQPQSC